MSFLDEVSYWISLEDKLKPQAEEAPGPDSKGDDDWVATHIGRGTFFTYQRVLIN